MEPSEGAAARTRLRDYFLLHGIIVIWGFTGILGRLISLDSAPLVAYRMAIAFAAVALWIAYRRLPWRLSGAGLRDTVATGCLVAIHWVFFFASIKASTVSIGLVCLSTGSFFTALIEPVFFRRRLRGYELLLGIATAVGVAVVFRFENGYTRGIVYGLIAAALGALFTVINGRLIQRHDSRIIGLYEMGGGAAVLALYLALWERPGWDALALNAGDALYLLVLGVVCTGFAFVASIHVMRSISPFTVILSVNLEPLYGILLALAIFGESELMSIGFYAGAAMILFSIWLNAMMLRRIQT